MMRNGSTFDVLGQLAALRRYARSLTRDDADAEDLVQDALVRAYEKRAGFDPERGDTRQGLRGWLFSILHNVFVDRRRARQAAAERERQLAEIETATGEPVQEHHMRLAQIRDAFMTLPEEQRAALHLVAMEGLGYAEAAAALGIPQGTLMSRLSRARAALRAVEDGTAASRPRLKIVGGPDEPSR
ncbi:sigma-70 family RNA polymerase sigma factor [Ancylobacter oerskovii]|uniref:Sigma-70 family RNA polymerase sigma factor n=1 Tax=Ancylobacter oerskovii TaxID=459519 RepID=A0ABW4YVL6_9HYPH|nr:sigma-70 family RNA polymerase sigma factor [Ancylobacter oerskovii]MBS7543128.1 sigma-70 family RNA polymerase sigma factor [Ancylobacter oerskovii]